MLTYKFLGNNGRLGNQLFQIASTIGLATRSGVPWKFPKWEYSSYLNVDQSWFEDNPQGNDLGGLYYQDYKNFNHVEQYIKQIFQLNNHPEFEAVQLQNHYFPKTENVEYIMVGVRRTDYLTAPDFYPIPTIDYYVKAVNYIKSLDASKTYKVVCFSDDIGWCKQNIPADIYYLNTHSIDIVKLFVISKCDHFVIANSTFHWWGAYLSSTNINKRVVYPVRWLGSGVPDKNTFDLFYPNWYGFSKTGDGINYPGMINVNILQAVDRHDL